MQGGERRKEVTTRPRTKKSRAVFRGELGCKGVVVLIRILYFLKKIYIFSIPLLHLSLEFHD